MIDGKLLERQIVAIDAHVNLLIGTSLAAEIIAEKPKKLETLTAETILQDLEARILRCVASSSRRIDDQRNLSSILTHRNGFDVIDIVRFR